MTDFTLPLTPRFLLSAELKPIQGMVFQPTGFPDVGAGVYRTPSNQEFLTVESHQSVANRLETAIWDDTTNELIEPVKGLSYVRVVDDKNAFLTTSVLEAHRLNSVYVEKSKLGDQFFRDILRNEIHYDAERPYIRGQLIKVLAKYDVSCLLHGIFLESVAGVLRLPRALSGFIEAENIHRVQTGGVKNDRVKATNNVEEDQTASAGFGNIIFHRTDFVAEKITAYFNLDLNQIRSYALGSDVEKLLFALSILKIHRFLNQGLRLRTACDLECVNVSVKGEIELPTAEETSKALPLLIAAVSSKGIFADPPITTTIFKWSNSKSGDSKGNKR